MKVRANYSKADKRNHYQALLDQLEPTPPKLPRALAFQIYDRAGDFFGTVQDIEEAESYKRIEGYTIKAVDCHYAGSRQI